MYAKKIIIETDTKGNIRKIPVLPANKRYEAIFLVIEDLPGEENVKRKPHSQIAGNIKFLGDVVNTCPEADWDLPE